MSASGRSSTAPSHSDARHSRIPVPLPAPCAVNGATLHRQGNGAGPHGARDTASGVAPDSMSPTGSECEFSDPNDSPPPASYDDALGDAHAGGSGSGWIAGTAAVGTASASASTSPGPSLHGFMQTTRGAAAITRPRTFLEATNCTWHAGAGAGVYGAPGASPALLADIKSAVDRCLMPPPPPRRKPTGRCGGMASSRGSASSGSRRGRGSGTSRSRNQRSAARSTKGQGSAPVAKRLRRRGSSIGPGRDTASPRHHRWPAGAPDDSDDDSDDGYDDSSDSGDDEGGQTRGTTKLEAATALAAFARDVAHVVATGSAPASASAASSAGAGAGTRLQPTPRGGLMELAGAAWSS